VYWGLGALATAVACLLLWRPLAAASSISAASAGTMRVWYPDWDGDGAGNRLGSYVSAEMPELPPYRWVLNSNDADDNDASVQLAPSSLLVSAERVPAEPRRVPPEPPLTLDPSDR
jgi:hypothetical protein